MAAGGFPQFWYELHHTLGEWAAPTFSSTLIPLAVIPLLTILYPDKHEDSEVARKFYTTLSGGDAQQLA